MIAFSRWTGELGDVSLSLNYLVAGPLKYAGDPSACDPEPTVVAVQNMLWLLAAFDEATGKVKAREP